LSSDIEITQIPAQLAERLGVDVFTASLILSAVIMLFTVCIVAFVIKKGSALTYGVLITEFITMGALIALGWLPYWILLITCLLVAIMFADSMRNLITGK